MSQIQAYSRNVAFLSRIPVLRTLAEYNPDFEIIPEYAQGYQPLKSDCNESTRESRVQRCKRSN